VKNRPQNRQSRFLKTELQKLSFRFWNVEVSSVRFGFYKTGIRQFSRVLHFPSNRPDAGESMSVQDYKWLLLGAGLHYQTNNMISQTA